MAIGMVEKIVKVAQGLENMALTTAMDRPARVSTRMNRTATDATPPMVELISFEAMFARLCPLCRTEAKRMTISCTAPAMTAPKMIHSAPGR